MYSVSLNNPYLLYIEDDNDDVELLRHALADTKFSFEIIAIPDGLEALKFLEMVKERNRLPEAILLDINLSRMDGKETFLCITKDKKLSRIPICIVSVSNTDTDRSYFAAHDIPFVTKPGNVQQFKDDIINAMKGLLAFSVDFQESKQNTA